MVLGAEIALAVFGVMALVSGKLNMGGGKFVEGSDARLLGVLALAPLPVSFGLALVLGLENAWIIEVSVLVLTLVFFFGYGSSVAKVPDADLEDV